MRTFRHFLLRPLRAARAHPHPLRAGGPKGGTWAAVPLRGAVLLGALLLAGGPAAAAPHFPGADLAHGRHLHHERKCAACHSEKTGRDEGFIYLRDERKVRTLADLRRYVSLCNSELRLELFPDDERDVAAYLNQQFYKLDK